MTSTQEDISDLLEESILENKVTAKYSAVSESLRSSIPEPQMCLMFCGGRNCKYEGVDKWKDNQAISGLYSSWVTQNILAMSRPNSSMIENYNIVGQFKENKIFSLINLQMLGEHEHCGPGLESSGFTYEPQVFMDANISFYNYGWRDYGVGSMKNLVDVIQVMQFAISEGKVAIHCHAGLGRTGVLIACYLLYTNRIQPQIAINYVRSKRPGSIQSNSQLQCIEEFHRFLLPMRIIFHLPEDSSSSSFTLSQFVARQRSLIHGKESKQLKYLPKIIFLCCNRLLELCRRLCRDEEHVKRLSILDCCLASELKDNSIQSNRIEDEKDAEVTVSEAVSQSINLESFAPVPLMATIQSTLNSSKLGTIESSRSDTAKSMKKKALSWLDVARAMSKTQYEESVTEVVNELKSVLNDSDSGWIGLDNEHNPEVLACLMWDWLDSLKEPVLTHQDLPVIVDEVTSFENKLSHLDRCTVQTIFYLIFTCMSLCPSNDSDQLSARDVNFEMMQRIISTLAHQSCVLERNDVTNDLEDGYFLRTSNQLGSVMKLDLSKKIYKFLTNFKKYIGQIGLPCDCPCAQLKSSHGKPQARFNSELAN